VDDTRPPAKVVDHVDGGQRRGHGRKHPQEKGAAHGEGVSKQALPLPRQETGNRHCDRSGNVRRGAEIARPSSPMAHGACAAQMWWSTQSPEVGVSLTSTFERTREPGIVTSTSDQPLVIESSKVPIGSPSTTTWTNPVCSGAERAMRRAARPGKR